MTKNDWRQHKICFACLVIFLSFLAARPPAHFKLSTEPLKIFQEKCKNYLMGLLLVQDFVLIAFSNEKKAEKDAAWLRKTKIRLHYIIFVSERKGKDLCLYKYVPPAPSGWAGQPRAVLATMPCMGFMFASCPLYWMDRKISSVRLQCFEMPVVTKLSCHLRLQNLQNNYAAIMRTDYRV